MLANETHYNRRKVVYIEDKVERSFFVRPIGKRSISNRRVLAGNWQHRWKIFNAYCGYANSIWSIQYLTDFSLFVSKNNIKINKRSFSFSTSTIINKNVSASSLLLYRLFILKFTYSYNYPAKPDFSFALKIYKHCPCLHTFNKFCKKQ